MHLPEIRPYGSSAILLEWDDNTANISQIIANWRSGLTVVFENKLEDISNGYTSIVLFLKSSRFQADIMQELTTIDSGTFDRNNKRYRKWEIPVLYDLKQEWDLDLVSKHCNLSPTEFISRHTQTVYTIRFIGFLPGFVYLDGLSPNLNIPRKDQPRVQVPTGAVGIGGNQTGIYPRNSPGGWQIIGRTPIPLFDINRPIPSPFQIGDSVQFCSINQSEFSAIEKAIKNSDYRLDQLCL